MILAEGVGTDLFRAVLQGAPPGSVYALIALGFVLAYKTSGVFNLAFGAQAYVSSLVFYKLNSGWKWGLPASLLLSVVILAPLLGFLLEWVVFRHLRTAPAVAKLIVTIGLSLALPAITELIVGFSKLKGGRPNGIAPDGNNVFYDPFGIYGWSRNELTMMIVGLLVTLGLGALFKYSALGLRMRAVVESPRLTEVNGIASDRVSAFAWALSSLFAGLAGVLIAPKFTAVIKGDYFNIVIVAIAAAAIGRLVSLPRAFFGGLGLGIFIALFNTFLPKWSDTQKWLKPLQDNLTPSIPFVVLFGLLVLSPNIRRARESTDPLAGVAPPPTMASAVGVERSLLQRIVPLVVGAVVLLIVFTRADAPWLFLISQTVALAVILLSITVITGLAGQISLCQGSYAAIGAFTVFQLAKEQGTSTIVAAFVGAAIAGVVGAILSLPIRRLSGIWVAIATLAFAFFFDAVMVKFKWVGGDAGGSGKVPRPKIGPWDFANNKSYLALILVVLAVVSLAVHQLTRGTFGQKLLALRGSEVAAQSIGISPARTRLVAFAVSAFIAGLGGGLLVIVQGQVNYGQNFTPFGSLFWLVLVVTIGVRSVGGAIGAAAAFHLFDKLILQGSFLGWILRSADRIPKWLFPIPADWRLILFGLGTINFARHPEGPIEYNRRKKAMKRIEREKAADAANAAATAAAAVEGVAR